MCVCGGAQGHIGGGPQGQGQGGAKGGKGITEAGSVRQGDHGGRKCEARGLRRQEV